MYIYRAETLKHRSTIIAVYTLEYILKILENPLENILESTYYFLQS